MSRIPVPPRRSIRRSWSRFRRAGIPVYGISAVFIDVDDTRAHSRDERVGVTEFYEGVEFMYPLMQALGGSGRKT